jgi:hypothetical protein
MALDYRDITARRALKSGRPSFELWLKAHRNTGLDLANVDFRGFDARGLTLANANLRQADFRSASLLEADLSGANLAGVQFGRANCDRATFRGADLSGSDMSAAVLRGADFVGANLHRATMTKAILDGANLTGANLRSTMLNETSLKNAILTNAVLLGTAFLDVDLSNVVDLLHVQHAGPCAISIGTFYRSHGSIPDKFLRGCGLPDIFIEYVSSLVKQPIQYYSCFISYSKQDEEFAERLYNDLQAQGVRCWFAPQDIQSGQKIHDQIDAAIRHYDKLLLILSNNSITSEWVKTEIAKARRRESTQTHKMLFPVRLISYEALQQWECFDADLGKDSAREIREYYIPDFSEWKHNYEHYRSEFEKLLRDLKANTPSAIT